MKVKFTTDFGSHKAGDELVTDEFVGKELVAMDVAKEVAEKKATVEAKPKRAAKKGA